MRIFDENDQLLQLVDREKGYLKPEKMLLCRHEAQDAVPEQGHYETIAAYPNGGKDVKWVVDVPGVEAKEAWDEYEDIDRFVAFTPRELAQRKIDQLKQKLQETDFHILKIVEGAATLLECADVIRQRKQWRQEINELEKIE